MINSFRKTGIAIAISTSLMTGCNMTQVKQTAGNAWDGTKTFVSENRVIVGAGLGMVVGYAVSGRSDSKLGILVGDIVGGVIANQLGKWLDAKEQADLEAYSLQQMNNSNSGYSVWKSPESSAQAVVKTTQSERKVQKLDMVKLKQVEVAPDLTLIGEKYVAKQSVNVRYTPGVKSNNKVGGIRQGGEFTAVGKTTNNWILVAQSGVTVGYVSGNPKFVGPATQQITSMQEDVGFDLDSLDDAQTAQVASGIDLDGISLDAGGLDLDQVEIAVETDCRQVSYDVTSEKGSGESKFQACKSLDGSWSIS